MKRIYQNVIKEHIANYSQMAFLSGPRQVGKTTIAKQYQRLTEPDEKHNVKSYYNWDKITDREQLLREQEKIAQKLIVSYSAIVKQSANKPLIILDEIHKYKHWKTMLKGLIDEYKESINILVTGSAKLNIFQRRGDSLMGRYFLYRIHPLSTAEICRTNLSQKPITDPIKINSESFNNLLKFGGFPEPFVKQEQKFYNRWQNLRKQQFFKEDVRNLMNIENLSQLEVLALLLQKQAGQLTNYSQLAKKVRVTDQTIRRWITVFEQLYYCFTIKPWTKNVTRSLLKEPKTYLWDWSIINDKGTKLKNFVASHLLKAVHFWTDSGFGDYQLYFLRNKDKQEVDFLITQNNIPWLMLEVKSSAKEPLGKSLHTFQAQIKAKHVLQIAFDLPFIDVDCFSFKTPKIVPAKTFLSQLV